LSLVVLAGARSARLYTQRVSLELDRMRAEMVLDGAIELIANQMLTDRALATGYRRLALNVGGADVVVEAVPSAGLVDVNVASPEMLEAFLQRVGGLAAAEATVMRARLKDFVDRDDTVSDGGGAEAAEYEAAGSPVRPANGLVTDVAELRSVLGMSPELYDIIFPFLGVNGGQKVDVDAAPPELIDALSGQPGWGVAYHAASSEMRAGLLQAGGMETVFTSSRAAAYGQTMRLSAEYQSADQRRWARRVWLDLGTRQDALTPWTTRSVEPLRRLGASSR
jgi:general secretion pathway protein K